MSTQYCRNCGKIVTPSHRFCMYCGTKAENAAAPQQTPEPFAASPPQAAPIPFAAPPPQAAPASPPTPIPIPQAVPAVTPPVPHRQPAPASPAADGKTVAFFDHGGTEPVVGWLVNVSGASRGQGYSLKTGRNSIGRSVDMDVPVMQELSVSRVNHAVITFEPLKQEFFVQPGEGRGLTYLNGEFLISHAPLRDYDRLKLGSSEFLFVSFCNQDFTWKDHLGEQPPQGTVK
ncbi:MAG: FHA domain-containing protein [Gracilibacteraceae bacterium]|nr:FHA domain-containing protein [Gracilibacteraceae bacterium]